MTCAMGQQPCLANPNVLYHTSTWFIRDNWLHSCTSRCLGRMAISNKNSELSERIHRPPQKVHHYSWKSGEYSCRQSGLPLPRVFGVRQHHSSYRSTPIILILLKIVTVIMTMIVRDGVNLSYAWYFLDKIKIKPRVWQILYEVFAQ